MGFSPSFYFLCSIVDVQKCLRFLHIDLYPLFCQIHLLSRVVFFVVPIGFSMYTLMSSANNDSFTSSFPIWLLLVSYSSLITVARSSNTMLNKSGERRHPCLLPDINVRAFSF